MCDNSQECSTIPSISLNYALSSIVIAIIMGDGHKKSIKDS